MLMVFCCKSFHNKVFVLPDQLNIIFQQVNWTIVKDFKVAGKLFTLTAKCVIVKV